MIDMQFKNKIKTQMLDYVSFAQSNVRDVEELRFSVAAFLSGLSTAYCHVIENEAEYETVNKAMQRATDDYCASLADAFNEYVDSAYDKKIENAIANHVAMDLVTIFGDKAAKACEYLASYGDLPSFVSEQNVYDAIKSYWDKAEIEEMPQHEMFEYIKDDYEVADKEQGYTPIYKKDGSIEWVDKAKHKAEHEAKVTAYYYFESGLSPEIAKNCIKSCMETYDDTKFCEA